MLLLLLLPCLSSAGPAERTLDADGAAASEEGLLLGVLVWREGSGVLYSHLADRPFAAASAIKTAIALDLLVTCADRLDEQPAGADGILNRGSHAAFEGFTEPQLRDVRSALAGKSTWEIARVMMGRSNAPNEVYNAACNLLMVKLGGPAAIERRLQALDPAYAGFDINRYMQAWNGDGDNRATPEAMVHLYRQIAEGSVPGLDEANVSRLRSLLLEEGDGGAGSIFAKSGTLYPEPIARVQAGYVKGPQGDIVYAVMGEIPGSLDPDPAQQFVRVMEVVDAMAEQCRKAGGE